MPAGQGAPTSPSSDPEARTRFRSFKSGLLGNQGSRAGESRPCSGLTGARVDPGTCPVVEAGHWRSQEPLQDTPEPRPHAAPRQGSCMSPPGPRTGPRPCGPLRRSQGCPGQQEGRGRPWDRAFLAARWGDTGSQDRAVSLSEIRAYHARGKAPVPNPDPPTPGPQTPRVGRLPRGPSGSAVCPGPLRPESPSWALSSTGGAEGRASRGVRRQEGEPGSTPGGHTR